MCAHVELIYKYPLTAARQSQVLGRVARNLRQTEEITVRHLGSHKLYLVNATTPGEHSPGGSRPTQALGKIGLLYIGRTVSPH